MKMNRAGTKIRVRPIAIARRGAMLVMALLFIVLATALSALIMANTAQLVRTTRQEHEEIVLRQLIDSGRAWFNVHGAMDPNASITLEGNAIVPENMIGEVTIRVDGKTPNVVIVTAHLRIAEHIISRTARFRTAS
ncbi:MAG: hypothetical protein HY287_15480 [Planctomycetes bacterium]|nr:hypothetical protein [Planctomycetota bacterium]MBI3835726.1 hypothetical protein [Planctomycetota bacterium]